MGTEARPRGHVERRASPLLLIAVLVMIAGSGAASLVSSATSKTPARYATTITSRGAINLAAVPLGDGYVSTAPKVGYVDSCITNFGIGGASVDGPWINSQAHTWDYLTKVEVSGAVSWPTASYKVTAAASRRIIVFNDLPTDHTTGAFPIQTSDPAFQYDHNPNRIAPQSFDWNLPRNPRLAKQASCTNGGPIGVLEDGVVLFNALDGGGRDAAAHELLDRCAGHPQMSDVYHHHDIPPCILDKTPKGRTTLVGYAIDGFGIYVQKDRHGTLPTNAELDACHGRVSRVLWNGKLRRIYHYVATLEYPYTIGCLRGSPINVGGAGGNPPLGPA